MASLEVGFSHDIFVEWASDAKNLVLFTERGQVFCRTLVDFSMISILSYITLVKELLALSSVL
jgi:hypothetical protein